MEGKKIFFTDTFLFQGNLEKNRNEETAKNLKLEVCFRKRTENKEQCVSAQGLYEVVNKNIIERLKEEDLTEMFPGEESSQNMLEWIWRELEPYAELVNCELYRVALWDTPMSKIEITK